MSGALWITFWGKEIQFTCKRLKISHFMKTCILNDFPQWHSLCEQYHAICHQLYTRYSKNLRAKHFFFWLVGYNNISLGYQTDYSSGVDRFQMTWDFD